MMFTSTLILACAAAVLASPGYLKLDIERERNPQLTKRQSSDNDLAQEIVPGEGGSVCAAPNASDTPLTLGSFTG